MLQLERVVQRRRVAAVGAIIGGKFRAIIFKCWVPNPNTACKHKNPLHKISHLQG